MGTRGAIGFFKDGQGKITYNHYDSYPEVLGLSILKEIKGFSVEQMKKAFNNLKLVKNSEAKPTPKEIKNFEKWSNASVGSQGMGNKEICTYYQLLRNVQGTLKPYITGEVNLIIDSEDFLIDSLFCEWAYIVNLDKEVLEVWEGFQKTPQENRYKITEKFNSGTESYFNCKIIREYPLKKLPTKNKFLKDLLK